MHPTQIINKSGWHLKIIIHTALPQLPRWRQKLGKEPLQIQHLLKEWNIVLCVVVSQILAIQQQFLLTLHSTLATCTWTQSSSAFPSFPTLLEKLCCLLVWHAKGQGLLLEEGSGWVSAFFFLWGTNTSAVLQPNFLAPSQYVVTSGWPVQGIVSLCSRGWAFPAKIHVQLPS